MRIPLIAGILLGVLVTLWSLVQAILETPTQTPLEGAFAGFVGTVATGLLVSLIAAALLRRKGIDRVDVAAGG
jgi:hypothetical protein